MGENYDIPYRKLRNSSLGYETNEFMSRFIRIKRPALGVLIIFVVIIIIYYQFPGTKKDVFEHAKTVYSQWPAYRNQMNESVSILQSRCFGKSILKSLSQIENNLKKWSKASDEVCNEWFEIFNKIYLISFRVGNINIPLEFLPKVSNWLNNDSALVEELHDQKIINIFNDVTKEHSTFSPLRAKRPQSRPINAKSYIQNLVSESAKSCDFCNYETCTSEDVFGRIKTKHSVSAANTFKVDRWHSLILPFKHNPLELTEEEIIDIFHAASLWFGQVNSMENEFKYPWLLWDSMPHAGASQVHPHVHVGLNSGAYVGMNENFRFAGERYFKLNGRNYFTDLTAIHSILGLSVQLGTATAIAQLTSKKDTEITILSEKPGVDFYKLVFHAIKVFYSMEIYDFSSLTIFPIKYSTEVEGGNLPAMMRIASRGDVSSVRSEISSFELFQYSNINVDPYEMVKLLQESIKNSNLF